MTSAARMSPMPAATDWRVIVMGGVKVGVVTAAGVAVFALLSRVVSGNTETILQGAMVLAGAAVFAYLPSVLFRPRDVDTIAWTAMVALLGALVFTVIDTAVFRPFDLYHWTWDAIGGGSGFWYIPVWWMAAATLAWLGAWITAIHGRDREPNIPAIAGQSVGLGVVAAAVLMAVGLVPFHAAGFALGIAIGLVAHVAIARVMHKG